MIRDFWGFNSLTCFPQTSLNVLYIPSMVFCRLQKIIRLSAMFKNFSRENFKNILWYNYFFLITADFELRGTGSSSSTRLKLMKVVTCFTGSGCLEIEYFLNSSLTYNISTNYFALFILFNQKYFSRNLTNLLWARLLQSENYLWNFQNSS